MSIPMNVPVVPPPVLTPLPPGWSEHVAPTGHKYYYNSFTKESSYIRPLPTFAHPLAQPVAPQPAQDKQKEKPAQKTPIPGTVWLRVTTTAGNVFYTHKPTKKSVWVIPDEIKDAVAELEKEEKRQEEENEKAEQAAQVERVRKEVESAAAKRKAVDDRPEAIDVVVSKKARVEDEADEEDENEEDEEEDEEDEEMEDWQREAAAQLAAEAEEEDRKKREAEEEAEEAKKREDEELKKREKEKGVPALNMPARVELSTEEAKALFKSLLREKDISPLLPWDTSLPLFVTDPRYVLLPSVSARRDAFDEYCRDRARELRAAKLAAAAAAAAASGDSQPGGENESKDGGRDDPKAAFDRLLKEDVTSTRTSWTEWRRKWKKDRRFYGWGRDERERERRFREYLRELGEKKRVAAEKAEKEFFALLKEKAKATPGSTWKEVKRGLDRDPRYDAVGSSSLREELFNTYLKTLFAKAGSSEPDKDSSADRPRGSAVASTSNAAIDEEQREERKRKERQERKVRAVRDREEKVRTEQARVEREMGRALSALSREEGELEFRNMLVDAIREPTATWDTALPQLKTDPRFTHSPLSFKHQQALFHAHIASLRSKHLAALHALFNAHAPALNTPFSALPLSSIQASLPAQKLGLVSDTDTDSRHLEREFHAWQREREEGARREFDAMLGENAFVEFWGRVQKIGGQGAGAKLGMGEEGREGEGEEEGEGGGGTADLKALARSIDVKEIERVLKNDRRYTMFDHIPEEREKWIREYMERLAAPKLSVHVPEHHS